jgi:polyferredoxin
MAALEKIGLGLFVAALAVFLWAFGTSQYRLTPEVVRQSIPRFRPTTPGWSPPCGPLLGQEYPSNFSFVGDVKEAINRVNDAFKAKGQWDQVIYNDYTFLLTKNASRGILTGNPWLWFSLIFGLAVAGGLLYAASRYTRGPAGIHNNGISSAPSRRGAGWASGWGVFLIGFYVLLYWFPEYITNWVVLVDPLSRALTGNPASQWFLYGVLYTLVILVLGVRMILKYRHSRYQMLRTGSVMFFQTAFAFLIPEILVLLHQPWYDFKNIWPLDYDFFYSYNLNQLVQSGAFGLFMLMWGILLIVVAVPVITYFYGKRWYCSWVCGCGGLAETLGDPYRQLSDKSLKAWKVERWTVHGVLAFAVGMTVITLVNYFSDYQLLGGLTGGVQKTYGFVIGAGFAGVVGTGFYPFMGSRVWCRFGCPLAAYLGLVQRFKSRFRITTNGGQCISCGNCSTYCEMGIDVRWYAQRGQNIVRSSCVGCGICAAGVPAGRAQTRKRPRGRPRRRAAHPDRQYGRPAE